VLSHRNDKPGTEVFIVDGAAAAALALGAHRPSEDSTYVLCRAAGELPVEFRLRVLRRTRSILAHRCIESLWYVVGAKSLEPSDSVHLLEALLPLLESGSRLTLASPRSCGGVVFGWVDALLGQRSADVNMGVRFYPDVSELRRGAALTPRSERRCG
jgi:hypothetical protein